MGPLETRALGLTECELRRVELQIEFANRVQAKVRMRLG
jgi:hypothetical protein